MDKPLLTQDLYDSIISDNSKFKEYWNTHLNVKIVNFMRQEIADRQRM